MAIEPIPYGYTDPVAYAGRTRTPKPDTTDNPRPAAKPTPYLDVGGPALVKAMGAYLEDRLQAAGDAARTSSVGYASGGSQVSGAAKGRILDISA